MVGRFNYKVVILWVLIVVASSCGDSYKDLGVRTNAECIVPVAHGNFHVGEVIRAFDVDSVLQSNDESEFVFSYSEDSIASIMFDDLVKLPSIISITEQRMEVGEIVVKPRVYNEYVSINDLKDHLKANEKIQKLPLAKSVVFPNIELSEEDDLTFEIEEFDFIRYGYFSSGEIKVTLKNTLPAACKVKLKVLDADGAFTEEIEFGYSSADGLQPNEEEQQIIGLSERSLNGVIKYRISSLIIEESDNLVDVNGDQGMVLNFGFLDMVVHKAEFKAADFEYETSTQRYDMLIPNNIGIGSLKVTKGILEFVISKDFEFDGSGRLIVPSILRNGEIVSKEFDLTGVGANTVSIDLKNTEVMLTSDGKFNAFEYKLAVAGQSGVEYFMLASDSEVNFSGSLKGLEIDYFSGDFGTQDFDTRLDGINLNQDLLEMISGQVFGDQPVLNIYFKNPVGIPVELDVVLNAYSQDGGHVALARNEPFALGYPQTEDQMPVNSILSFNCSNSNINDFVQLPPDSTIDLYANFMVNPDGVDSENLNFVHMDEPFTIGLDFEAPILLKGTFFNYVDTIPLSGFDLNSFMNQAQLIFQSINTVPLSINFNVQAYDSIANKPLGNQHFVTVLDAAVTDMFGNVLDTAISENYLVLDEAAIEAFSAANGLIIDASFLSPESGTNPAKLSDDQRFEVNVILDVKPTR